MWGRESAWLWPAVAGTFQPTHLGGGCTERGREEGREWMTQSLSEGVNRVTLV